MVEVLPVWGVVITRENGTKFYARGPGAVAVWFDKGPAVAYAKALKEGGIKRADVVRLKVTVEPSPTLRGPK